MNLITKRLTLNTVTVKVSTRDGFDPRYTVRIVGQLKPKTLRLLTRRALLDTFTLSDDTRVSIENDNFVIESVKTIEGLYECDALDFLAIAKSVQKRTR